jgi:hypothetical protein
MSLPLLFFLLFLHLVSSFGPFSTFTLRYARTLVSVCLITHYGFSELRTKGGMIPRTRSLYLSLFTHIWRRKEYTFTKS